MRRNCSHRRKLPSLLLLLHALLQHALFVLLQHKLIASQPPDLLSESALLGLACSSLTNLLAILTNCLIHCTLQKHGHEIILALPLPSQGLKHLCFRRTLAMHISYTTGVLLPDLTMRTIFQDIHARNDISDVLVQRRTFARNITVASSSLASQSTDVIS